ncbi:MAG: hypothetical protein ABEL76_10950 [Bradymonadaceae bacterium]
MTQDGRRFFVTFAADSSQRVRLFSHRENTPFSRWKTRRQLRADDPQAAMARGLRADSGDSVYLVHQNNDVGRDGRYGVARYDKKDDRWPNRAYFGSENDGARVHSFALTSSFELCLSSRLRGNLLVTCGTMVDLDRERKFFDNQSLSRRYPSSIVEGADGTLYVAFSPGDNSELKVAIRSPDGSWSVERVFGGSTFGISTAIDRTGDLVLTFYTCAGAGDGCSLKIIRERPDQLKR